MPGHLIHAGRSAADRHQPVFAGHLQTGNYVTVVNGSVGDAAASRVARVSWSRDPAGGGGGGVYAPLTARGTLVVDDVVVSCYAELSSDAAAHLSLAPLRLVHRVTASLSRWLLPPPSSSSFQRGAPPRLVDGVHWYAAVLWRLAGAVVPAEFWWSGVA